MATAATDPIEALRVLADPDSWTQSALDLAREWPLIYGHDAPWEMARRALGEHALAEEVLRFVVHGKAAPAGSKKSVPKKGSPGQWIVIDDSAKSRPWKNQVGERAAELWDGQPLLDCPLSVEFTFYRVRGVTQYRSGRYAHLLKDSAPAYPTAAPDVLKTARAVEDALTGVVYRDDSRIVEELLRKRWGDRECVEVVVRTLPSTLQSLACPDQPTLEESAHDEPPDGAD